VTTETPNSVDNSELRTKPFSRARFVMESRRCLVKTRGKWMLPIVNGRLNERADLFKLERFAAVDFLLYNHYFPIWKEWLAAICKD
jgi:hypothetical protein